MLQPHQVHPNDKGHYNGYIGYYWSKYTIARRYRPTRILEIGVRAGYSALAFLEAAHDQGRHQEVVYVGIDGETGTHGGEGGPYLPWAEKILNEPHGPEYKVILLEANTQRALPESVIQVLENEGRFDLIHVDGDHTKRGALSDLDLAVGFLMPNGVILIDDYDRAPAVKEAIDEWIETHPEWDHLYIPSFNGDVAITRLGGGTELDPIDTPEIGRVAPTPEAPQWIDSYEKAKLTDHIRAGDKVLIRFGHGLGDTMMFMPIFDKLQRDYPEVKFYLYLESGQEHFWPSVPKMHAEGLGMDKVFVVHFPMSEGHAHGLTKQHYCCEVEIGIDPPEEEFAQLKEYKAYPSPYVLCHFHGTALPDSVNCPANVAAVIWEEVLAAGKIPVECHFMHMFANPVNEQFDWIERHVRDVQPTIHKLAQMMAHSFAFIGVASGPFCVSMGFNPERTLYLENRHPVATYAKRETPASINVNGYQKGEVQRWLGTLS